MKLNAMNPMAQLLARGAKKPTAKPNAPKDDVKAPASGMGSDGFKCSSKGGGDKVGDAIKGAEKGADKAGSAGEKGGKDAFGGKFDAFKNKLAKAKELEGKEGADKKEAGDKKDVEGKDDVDGKGDVDGKDELDGKDDVEGQDELGGEDGGQGFGQDDWAGGADEAA